jgi:hypothetical protein
MAGVLTQRVEYDAGFQDTNVDHVGFGGGRGSGRLDVIGASLRFMPLDKAVAGVLDEE